MTEELTESQVRSLALDVLITAAYEQLPADRIRLHVIEGLLGLRPEDVMRVGAALAVIATGWGVRDRQEWLSWLRRERPVVEIDTIQWEKS